MKANQSFLVAILALTLFILGSLRGWSQQQDSSLFQFEIAFNNVEHARESIRKDPGLINKKLLGDDTPLIRSVSSGYKEMFEMLLTNNADVNAQGHMGITALHLAAAIGNVREVELLIEHKADVSARDIDGYTPIINAYGSADVIKLLLAHHANINDQATGGDTVLSRAINMNSSFAIVKCLLTNGADVTIGDLPDAVWSCQNTNVIALLVPYFRNSTNANAQELLGRILGVVMEHSQMDKISTIVAACTSFQTNLLHKAVMSGIDADVRSFLAAHPDFVNDKEFFGWSPLHMASLSGQSIVAETLLSNHADPDSLDALHSTPLLWAAFFGHSNLVEVLLRHKANMDVTGNTENTPLDFAIERGFVSIAAMLITNGANLGPHKWWGDTPLHHATEKENVELIKLLVAHGANVNAVRGGNYKQTPLDIAVSGGSAEAVRVLIASGANLEARMQTHAGSVKTLFGLWVEGGCNTNIAEQLFAAGCSLNATNGDGQTSLHIAAAQSQKQAIQWLLDHKADVNAKDKNGQTPLHLAMTGGNTNAIQCLLDYKADVNAIDNNGKNPLALVEDLKINFYQTYRGARFDFKAVEDLLLANGAKGPVLTPDPNSAPQVFN